MRDICVTGSSGLIGSELVYQLSDRWPNAVIHCVDIVDGVDCRDFFAADLKVDLVIHCAALTGGIEGTMNNAPMQSATNAQLDGAFFEWALRTKPHRAVYISSSCAYPMLPLDMVYDLVEEDIDYDQIGTHPDQPYGWVKLTGEVIGNAVRDAGVPVSIVRPFAVYGDDQENVRMLPKFVERALADDEVFEVWGPGTQASDFIHVEDAANAIITMVCRGFDGPVNLGTGVGTTVDEAARLVMDAVGIDRPIVHNMEKPYGPRWRVADTSLLETFYTPKISIAEGIERMVAFHQ